MPQPAQIAMHKRQHQYKALAIRNTIRILTLEPGQEDDLLTGTLQAVHIDSAGSYEALSYVWSDPGPADCGYEILIRDGDSQGFLTLRGGSIYAALCRLRLPDRGRRIWADQICINQDDLVERGQQVPFMNRIFRDAAHVLVWLGLDTNNEAVFAFDLIRELDEALTSHLAHTTLHGPDTVELEKHLRDSQKALQALTDRVWFKRGWIVQEIGTSTPATMIWGDATIDWDTLASVCERLKGYHDLRSALGISTSDISFLYRRFIEPDEKTHHANRFNFVYELQRGRHLRFSDDRDRVFVYLGHFSVRTRHPLGCGPLSIRADYTKTVEQTYIDVAVQILRANPASACIVLAAVQHPPHGLPSLVGPRSKTEVNPVPRPRDEHSLPSWVPDWRRSEGIILAEPVCPHLAHGKSTTQLEVVEHDGLVLRFDGVKIDSIEECSLPLRDRDFYEKKTPGSPSTTIEGLWREICGKESFSLEDDYLNGKAAFFAFMQTLSNGCVQAAGHECRPYHDVPERVWLQKATSYIVETLGTYGDVSEDIRSVAGETGREGVHETWSRWAASAADSRIFARTRSGYYVLGPVALEVGDIVCVLFGCKVPFCLRPMGERYLLVGECYVHGLMKGGAMDMLARDQLHKKTFDIV
ncbi:hypothetical protein N8I77_009585 [Diaporthe amygdali]|uniref:Heterokaryon incompatibility domain-containing protein n=1 Tax=Phomopsis amygdali TaxID=1214568 RepID=A0AAD9SA44_PHOAM|nr:hypothetical protein N8I77_009585 [Diaporthe amygdali]